MIQSFSFSRIPKIIFGPGKLKELFQIIPQFGNKVLIITGSHSLKNSGNWDNIESLCKQSGLILSHLTASGEPSPEMIDDAVKKFKNQNLDLIIGIGGGSVIDTGKAISGMIKKNDSVKDYLEGVGNKEHDGEKLPYIAIPTTSGTGSEATKNAVISEVGPNGFKKSLRHDNLIPNVAIIDPELMLSCPSSVTAACGLDAFTQLLESYVSPSSSPLTDALALDGMQHVKDALIPATSDSASDVNVRSKMAYGSLVSGITLANAGLGVVHGFASSIGGEFNIPHGIVCGTLLAEATRKNIEKLKEAGKEGTPALKKFAKVGEILANKPQTAKEVLKNADYLVQILDDWTSELRISRLSKFGVSEREIEHLAEITSQKNNPVSLKKMDLVHILKRRL
jgi:alcohol dehydrogenase class IV